MFCVGYFCFSSRRRHTRCALVTGVQTCALPIYLPTQRPVVRDDGHIDLSSIKTDADAILVVRFEGAGYTSSSTTALQPWAIVEVELFDTRTRKALYAKTFNGGEDQIGRAHV